LTGIRQPLSLTQIGSFDSAGGGQVQVQIAHDARRTAQQGCERASRGTAHWCCNDLNIHLGPELVGFAAKVASAWSGRSVIA